MDQLIAEHNRLQTNLMNATEDSVQIAIYERMQRIATKIFALS